MLNLIPKPVSVTPAAGHFTLTPAAKIIVPPGAEDLLAIGRMLSNWIEETTGLAIPAQFGDAAPPEGNIHLREGAADAALGAEGYRLTVSPRGVQIEAPHKAGVFYGAQTLRQMLFHAGGTRIPSVKIHDTPRFRWRGAMLDVARHFFGVAEVKRYLDLLAAYKMNVLHLHLSDDQGWRIEIKSWPNLSAHGGQTAVGGDAGGFYTQVQYAELVAYAQERQITIVPEIDLPGHTNAALASYPELNCNGTAPGLYTGMEVGFSSLCIQKEITYRFVDEVLGEIAALTPGAYLHVGGDEAKATPKADYLRFMARVAEIVAAHGKTMVAWEEAAQCDLAPETVLQYWADIEHAKTAAQKGHPMILSPASRAYLDIKYDAGTPLGLTWAGTVDTERAYTWDPASEVPGLPEARILGVEAPLWSETLRTMADVEFMAFPRLIGIAEIGWSPALGRDWDEYRQRLAVEGLRLQRWGVNFYRDPGVNWR